MVPSVFRLALLVIAASLLSLAACQRGPAVPELAAYGPVEPAVAAVLTERLTPGGRLIAAHWIGMSADHRLRGHRVHDLLADALPTWVLAHHAVHLDESHDGYRLDVWDRP